MNELFERDAHEEWLEHCRQLDVAVTEIIKLKSQLNTATELLHSCLEWDNGGERDYEKIVAFLNEHNGDLK